MMPTMIARLGLLAAMFAVLSQGILPHRLAAHRMADLTTGGTGALILATICGDLGGDRTGPRSPGAPGHDHACVLCSMCPAGCSSGDVGMPPAGLQPAPSRVLVIALRPTIGGRGVTAGSVRTGQPRGPPIRA